MSTRPRLLNATERAKARAQYEAAPRATWLAVRAAVAQSYPCRCPVAAPCDGRTWQGIMMCPCWGRGSRASLRCCGERAGSW